MNAATTITFEVSDVERATASLPEVAYKDAVEAQITPIKPLMFRRRTDSELSPDSAQGVPGAPDSRPVESCSRYHGRLLAEVSFHPVVAAAHIAFRDHRPLCLCPDTIWLMIIQGVANHINAHAEELRPRIVSHHEKLTIQVRRDDFVKASPENPWAEVFNDFSSQIRDHVGPNIELFVPRFSTTSPVERAAAEVVLLDAMQSYFEYRCFSACGIPSITLEGTDEDWTALARRVQGFREFGLGSWFDVLSPILGQFAKAAQGDVDPTFWGSLYKFDDRSGGRVVTGWITAFFPYLKDYRTKQVSVRHRLLFGDDEKLLESMLHPPDDESLWGTPGLSVPSFPSGLSKAPFRWDYLDRSFDMEFLGGFVGVAQDQETLTLRPEIGWAVRESTGDRMIKEVVHPGCPAKIQEYSSHGHLAAHVRRHFHDLIESALRTCRKFRSQ
jgi:Domain of unknown function (DUF4419)